MFDILANILICWDSGDKDWCVFVYIMCIVCAHEHMRWAPYMIFYFSIYISIPQTNVALGVMAVLFEDSILLRGQNLCAGTGLCGFLWSPSYLLDICWTFAIYHTFYDLSKLKCRWLPISAINLFNICSKCVKQYV